MKLFNRLKKQNTLSKAGFTMVELIVSFALMGIFLVATTMAISTSMIQYYEERELMSAFEVADSVLSMVKEDIRTMQWSVNPSDEKDISGIGYVKLRNGSGATVPCLSASDTLTGDTIEFVMAGSDDNDCAEQIDAKGFVGSDGSKGYLLKNHSIIAGKDQLLQGLDAGYLTFRYYRKDIQEDNDNYKNCYIDKCVDGTKLAAAVSIPSDKKLARDAEERISSELYGNFKIELSFTVKPEDYASTSSTDDYIVKSVGMKVRVLDSDGALVYEKSSSVALLNKVLYKSAATMYSDVNP